jgi:hypothetical protein
LDAVGERVRERLGGSRGRPLSTSGDPVLTLEPFIEAVREGVEAAGWEMSGLQKTTSHQFEGRWQGESTRSAYLFFHRPERWDAVGIDVYLDETSRGLQGTLSLVLEGPRLSGIGDPADALALLGAAAGERLPRGYRTPISLRVRLPEPSAQPGTSEVEVRFKVRIPSSAVDTGVPTVKALTAAVVRSFENLLAHPGIQTLMVLD